MKIIKTFECEKCRKRFADYDACQSHEMQHAIQPAIDHFKNDLARIFQRQEPVPCARKKDHLHD